MVLDVEYEEHLLKLYNYAIHELTTYADKFFDIDIKYIIDDLNREDTKIYIIKLSVQMLSKLDIVNIKDIHGYVCATFDAIFKYLFDIDFNFNFHKTYENFEKFQFDLLVTNKWNFRIQV